jgi:hypothetical protein
MTGGEDDLPAGNDITTGRTNAAHAAAFDDKVGDTGVEVDLASSVTDRQSNGGHNLRKLVGADVGVGVE